MESSLHDFYKMTLRSAALASKFAPLLYRPPKPWFLSPSSYKLLKYYSKDSVFSLFSGGFPISSEDLEIFLRLNIIISLKIVCPFDL